MNGAGDENSPGKQERILYEHQTWRDAVLVTDQQLVLGEETWLIKDIKQIHLYPCQVVTGWIPLSPEKPYPKSYWIACVSIGLALLLSVAEIRSSTHPTLYMCLAGAFLCWRQAVLCIWWQRIREKRMPYK